MKKKLFLLMGITLFLPAPYLTAHDQEDFDRITDFSVTIKTLDRSLSDPGSVSIDPEKLVLLNGTVSEITILDPDKDRFLVRVDLVTGEWIGLDEVKSYRCLVLFQGPRYHPLFPSRMPKKPVSPVIATNDRILVVARLLEPVTVENGEKAWLLQGFHVRRLH